jgi:hypothetical protein
LAGYFFFSSRAQLDAGLLQTYYGGIVDPFFPSLECDPNQLDHALLIVGMNVGCGVELFFYVSFDLFIFTIWFVLVSILALFLVFISSYFVCLFVCLFF